MYKLKAYFTHRNITIKNEEKYLRLYDIDYYFNDRVSEARARARIRKDMFIDRNKLIHIDPKETICAEL